MANTVASFFDGWQSDRQQMKEQVPDITRGFGGFYQSIMKEGALSLREKELIALAIVDFPTKSGRSISGFC